MSLIWTGGGAGEEGRGVGLDPGKWCDGADPALLTVASGSAGRCLRR